MKKILFYMFTVMFIVLVYWGVIELIMLLPHGGEKWQDIPTWYKPLFLLINIGVWAGVYAAVYFIVGLAHRKILD